MARSVRSAKLETRSARLKLPVRRKPYNGPSLARGVVLLYRRNRGNGTWVLKASDGHGKYWTKRIAEADDLDKSNRDSILTYFEAQDTAKKLARRGGDDEAAMLAPTTIHQALVAYRVDLASRGARPYNAEHARVHLTPLLLSKPVALLTSKELKAWRDGMLATLAPATINRICNSLCAALELARQFDPHSIKSADAWETGLAGLPDAGRARNVVLTDAMVQRFVAAAYRHDPALGLFVDVLAVTGARPGQASRLLVEDLHDHPSKPKIMLPKSGKGGGRNRAAKKSERYSVPITPALAKRLKAAAAGRAGDAPLLVRANGLSWGDYDPAQNYRAPVREVFKSIGVDPDTTTLYSLRHSAIVRMLLKNVPIRLIAALCNTSVFQIEKNYSKHITEHAIDDISRGALLSEPAAAADAKVIPLSR
jgi:integrase